MELAGGWQNRCFFCCCQIYITATKLIIIKRSETVRAALTGNKTRLAKLATLCVSTVLPALLCTTNIGNLLSAYRPFFTLQAD